MMPSPAFEYGIEAIALAFMIVLLSGLASMLISKRTKFPYTPLLIFFGILVGPVLHLILPNTARVLFYYIRAFGLFIVMFSAGFQIRVSLLKKHMLVIGLLDTLGLLITALVAGIIFQFVFHVSWAVGFLFGAIVSGTDPATLIPLFKEHKIDEGIETTILTESIFNGPLAIILTMVAFIFVLPEIPSLQDLISISPGGSLYFVAVIFFIYQIFASLVIAGAFAVVTYYLIKRFNLHTTPYPEILGLGMAFGGYVAGEVLHASGFLVVTIIAIILGNHRFFFKDGRKEKDMDEAVRHNIDFNEGLSTFSIIFIFVLLGASLSAGDATSSVLLYGTFVALLVIFVARPLATLVILPKTGIKKYLFIAFEGPKGAVAASMATLPIVIGKIYGDQNLIMWGSFILVSTLMTVFLSMILESAWMPYLKRKLLDE